MDIEVVVEIPRGSRNKYEMDHATGQIRLDRMLFTSIEAASTEPGVKHGPAPSSSY